MRSILAEPVEEMVAAMTTEEKRSLAQALMRMVAAELAGDDSDPERCPLCHCAKFVKKGRDADGSQRWLCRGCGRTFGRKTMRVIAQSKLDEGTWMAYAEGMADGATPHEPLSGNSSKGRFEMPRRRHKSGRSLHVRGVSGQLARVVCAANDRGGVICELVGRAHSTAGAVRSALEGRVLPGTPVATDDLALYDSVCDALGLVHEVRPAKPKAGERALGMVNALHKRLADFLRPFNGVATRRLGRYLAWFSWTQQFRGGSADMRELVSREALSGGYEATIRGIFAEPRFQMEYWEARGWSAA